MSKALSPKKAIRAMCFGCVEEYSSKAVELCTSPKCHLFHLRLPNKMDEGQAPYKDERQTIPVRAIRKHCLECVGYVYEEVKNCTVPNCPLYIHRFGVNPVQSASRVEQYQKGDMTCISKQEGRKY